MCSQTSASRDRRAAMMFHYIDYADTKVRMRNRQREREMRRGRKRIGKAVNKHIQTDKGERGRGNVERRSKCKHDGESM